MWETIDSLSKHFLVPTLGQALGSRVGVGVGGRGYEINKTYFLSPLKSAGAAD